MSRPLGSPKTGGRVKGTPNRKTQELMQRCEKLNVDPFAILCYYAGRDWESLGYKSPTTTKVLKDGGTIDVDIITTDQQIECAKELCGYLYAKKKAVEMSNDPENPVEYGTVSAEQLLELVKAAKGE